MATRTTPSGASAARERLLQTATELFYREGIHSVGVDRIIAAAGVTRATFYRHFPSKEDLVEAYLGVEDATIRGAFDAAHAATDDPDELVGLVIEGLADDVARLHTRGCPFINAAAEYPDADSPVRQAIGEHREWFRGELEVDARRGGGRRPRDIRRAARAASRRRHGRGLPRRLGARAPRLRRRRDPRGRAHSVARAAPPAPGTMCN